MTMMKFRVNEEVKEAYSVYDILAEELDEEIYDEWLDETCEPVRIGSLEYSPSIVLERVDPIAYRCGYSDFLDYLGSNAEYELEQYGETTVYGLWIELVNEEEEAA